MASKKSGKPSGKAAPKAKQKKNPKLKSAAAKKAGPAKKAAAKKPAKKTATAAKAKASDKKASVKARKATKSGKAAKATAPSKKAGTLKASAKATPKASAKASAKTATKTATKTAAKTATKAGAFEKLFSPLDDRVLIEPQGRSEKTAGGLYIPETVQERPNQGVVIAVGPGARTKKGAIRPMDVKMGDQVLYGTYSGVSLEFGGRDVILLREEEILGIVKS